MKYVLLFLFSISLSHAFTLNNNFGAKFGKSKVKVYIDGNGVRRLISSKIDKEYELETEYMPQDWHEKLIIALSHDEVYFDTVRLQKSAAYEINYEEEDELPCGITLNKASAKMTKNTTIRNNNC